MGKVKNGDVIKVSRMDGLYYHYGIYVKRWLWSDSVIHYTGETGPGDFNGMVRETSVGEFLNGESDFIVVDLAGNSNYPYLYSGRETVRRAKSMIGARNYSLRFNNCEHFAKWCKTGIKRSLQTEGLAEILLAPVEFCIDLKNGFSDFFDDLL
ncbi:MAG: lecithin retinol acyltransferase family protein [Synergistaceae bacterium]|nr:lecithin retinol acyltransferase family protein [Synergistaceae bacterium]